MLYYRTEQHTVLPYCVLQRQFHYWAVSSVIANEGPLQRLSHFSFRFWQTVCERKRWWTSLRLSYASAQREHGKIHCRDCEQDVTSLGYFVHEQTPWCGFEINFVFESINKNIRQNPVTLFSSCVFSSNCDSRALSLSSTLPWRSSALFRAATRCASSALTWNTNQQNCRGENGV